MKFTPILLTGVLAVSTALLAPLTAQAQAFPTKTVTIVSPFPPGGFNDILARLTAQKFTEFWNQQVIVENRPGANMIVGLAAVAKSAPDGHTLAMGAIPHVINPALYKLPFDPVKDFTAVGLICSVPNLLVVTTGTPVNNVKEFVAYAKANPGKLAFGSTGNGSTGHLAGERLKVTAGINMVHVPYKGAAQAITDLIAGQFQVYIGATTSVLPHVRSGKLRALGITTTKRVATLPDMPTVAESLPGFQMSSWYGLLGPAGIPTPVVNKINADLRRFVELPDIRDRLLKDGADPVIATPEEFAASIREDIPIWQKVVQATGVKVE